MTTDSAENSPPLASPGNEPGMEPGGTPPGAPLESPSPASQASEQDAGPPRRRIGSQRAGAPKPRPKPNVRPKVVEPSLAPTAKVEVPNLRAALAPELEQEIEEALGGMSLDDALSPGNSLSPDAPLAAAAGVGAELEPESRHQARVARIHRDNVFVELGGRNQGILALHTFSTPPEIGALVEVQVSRFDAEDGLYTLTLPGGAVDISGWADLTPGIVVEARITGHNKGGLECEVNNVRGFIPAGQIAPYRVEDFSQFVGEKMACLVTEANIDRRNLVLSRRSVLEREKQANKEKLLAELAEGQVRDGIVRSIQDYGAFVDMGGIDGLVHVSQLSWQRVKHPSEVLTVGQAVKVLIRKIDPDTGKLSLTLRDLSENPWNSAPHKYPVSGIFRGTVSKIMDFGAFVQLEPGVEGLVHISELAHGRVFRVSDVVKEGQEVEVKVVSVDPEQQRIGLSIKATLAKAAPKAESPEPEPEEEPAPPPVSKRKGPLKGGTERSSGGAKFGLNW